MKGTIYGNRLSRGMQVNKSLGTVAISNSLNILEWSPMYVYMDNWNFLCNLLVIKLTDIQAVCEYARLTMNGGLKDLLNKGDYN
jgi:hypothetical protein